MPVHLLEVFLFVVVAAEADDAEMRKKRAERKNHRAGQPLRQIVDILRRADFTIPQLIRAARDRPKQPGRAVFQPTRENVRRCAAERHNCRNCRIDNRISRPARQNVAERIRIVVGVTLRLADSVGACSVQPLAAPDLLGGNAVRFAPRCQRVDIILLLEDHVLRRQRPAVEIVEVIQHALVTDFQRVPEDVTSLVNVLVCIDPVAVFAAVKQRLLILQKVRVRRLHEVAAFSNERLRLLKVLVFPSIQGFGNPRNLVFRHHDRHKTRIAYHIADMRCRVEQHREIPPRRPFFKPGGRNLPPDVAVNVFENFGALFLGLRRAELLHKLLVDPDRLAEQLLRDCLVVLSLERAEVGVLAEALLRRLAHRARFVLQRSFQRRAGLFLGHLGEVLPDDFGSLTGGIGGNAEIFDQVALDAPQHGCALKRVAADDLADGRTRLAHCTADLILHHLRRRFLCGGLAHIAQDRVPQHNCVVPHRLHSLIQAVVDVQRDPVCITERCPQRRLPDAAVLADCSFGDRTQHHAAVRHIV